MSSEEVKEFSMDEAQEVEEFEEDDENADESEDLGKRKQKINEFNVEGNQVLNQTNIQTLNLKVNYNEKSENERKKTKSRYDLQKKEDCIKFVERFKNGDYLAAAIILCVFEAVAIGEFPWLMETLLRYLPNSKNEEKREEYDRCPDSYIALDTILEVIGAQKFITDKGEICISLGINNVHPLENIWEQFLLLRETIISWLISFLEMQKSNTIFETYQIVTAFTKIIMLDKRTAEKHIFPRLYSNPENVWLLGNILFRLYEIDEKKEYWDELIIRWAGSRSNWLWKASYLTYALFVEHNIEVKGEDKLKKIFAQRICSLRKIDINFILTILFLSVKVRTRFCEILNMAYEDEEDKEEVVYKYLAIIRNGFYWIGASHMEIPLLICDTKEQQYYLENIISYIMERNCLQKQLFSILKSYIKEITNYRYSEEIVQYMTAYFHNMSLGGRDNIKEVVYFFKECECQLVKDMCFFGKCMLKKKEGSNMNEIKNKIIINDKPYENGFFPQIPNYRKHGTAIILTGGSGEDIIVDGITTTKKIRKGKYTRVIEISILPYMGEIRFEVPSKENTYSFNVFIKLIIQVVDPLVFYLNCNIDLDVYFFNIFFPDVKKITRKYSILDFENMEEEINDIMHGHNMSEYALGIEYQVSIVTVEVGEKAKRYLEKYEEQRLNAILKHQVTEKMEGVMDSYEEAVRAEVLEGKISKSEAILLIDKYYRDKVSENMDYFLKLKENDLISASTAREYTESELKKIVGRNLGVQDDKYIGSDSLQILNIDEFYKED